MNALASRTEAAVKRPAARGDFFAIDRRCWASISCLGLNEMVAYVVLARGSGSDQRSTSWSVNAIEKYTGLARKRVQAAIDTLTRREFVEVKRLGSRPKYYLTPAHLVPNCLPGTPQRGLFDDDVADKPDWIWLPNALVDGAAEEVSPLEVLRQSQQAPMLRLFIHLYHAQNMRDDGGIHWRMVRRGYSREFLEQYSKYRIYGFTEGKIEGWATAPFVAAFMTGELKKDPADGQMRDAGWPSLYAALGELERLGLIVFVPHLVEADTDSANIIHPYGLRRDGVESGEPVERELGFAAHDAGMLMLTPEQRAAASGLRVAPVLAHIGGVQLVGILRLRYHARTQATADWYAQMDKSAEMVVRYRQIEQQLRINLGRKPREQHQGESRCHQS